MGYMVLSDRNVVSPHVNNVSVKMMSRAIKALTLTASRIGQQNLKRQLSFKKHADFALLASRSR